MTTNWILILFLFRGDEHDEDDILQTEQVGVDDDDNLLNEKPFWIDDENIQWLFDHDDKQIQQVGVEVYFYDIFVIDDEVVECEME